MPTASVTDLAATPGVKIKLIDHADLVDKMNAKYGKLYSAGTIKAGTYPGYDKDNKNTEVWNIIVTGNKMSDDDAYKIVKTLVEKKADIVAVHKEAESFSLAQPDPGTFAGSVPSRRFEVFQGTGHRQVIAICLSLHQMPGLCRAFSFHASPQEYLE